MESSNYKEYQIHKINKMFEQFLEALELKISRFSFNSFTFCFSFITRCLFKAVFSPPDRNGKE